MNCNDRYRERINELIQAARPLDDDEWAAALRLFMRRRPFVPPSTVIPSRRAAW